MNAVATQTPLAAADFGAYYAAVHGFTPFPWQQALVDHLAAGRGWPQALDLPRMRELEAVAVDLGMSVLVEL